MASKKTIPPNNNNLSTAAAVLGSPALFARHCSGGSFKLVRHVKYISDHLVKVANGQIKKLLLVLPRNHSKTSTVNWFLTWYMGLNPDKEIVYVSNSASLVETSSAFIRGQLERWGPELFGIRPTGPAGSWRIDGHKGKLHVAGINGAVAGRRASVLLIDDAVRDCQEALSEITRQKIWDKYHSVLRPTLHPSGATVVVGTPYHAFDFLSKLVHEAEHPDPLSDAEPWTLIKLPAFCEQEGCPLGRKIGEPLWPERMSEKVLNEIRAGDEYWFGSQFQLRVAPRGGGLFKEHAFSSVSKSSPYESRRVRGWDIASSSKSSACYTVGVLIARDKDGKFWIEDVKRIRANPDQRNQFILQTAHQDKQRYGPHAPTIVLEKQPGAAGIDLHLQFVRMLAGFSVREYLPSRMTGDKELRAEPLASQLSAGNCTLVEGSWNGTFTGECLLFPNGSIDSIDAAAIAFNTLTKARPTGTLLMLPFNSPNGNNTFQLVVTTPEQLPKLKLEQDVLLVSISNPDQQLQLEHNLKVIDRHNTAFLDLDTSECQETWDKPHPPYTKTASELIFTKALATRLWGYLLRARGTVPGGIVLVEEEGGRRALSIAMGIVDLYNLPRDKTIAGTEVLVEKDTPVPNPTIYKLTKECKQPVPGDLPIGRSTSISPRLWQ